MSRENVEVVLRGNAAFNRGDYVGFAETLHPEVEFGDLAHAADVPETLKGAQVLLSLLSEWRESFDDFRAEISECIEAGDHVVCVTRWTGRGRASDAAVEVSQVDVYELRDGKIVRATLAYPDKATALEAIGRGSSQVQSPRLTPVQAAARVNVRCVTPLGEEVASIS